MLHIRPYTYRTMLYSGDVYNGFVYSVTYIHVLQVCCMIIVLLYLREHMTFTGKV